MNSLQVRLVLLQMFVIGCGVSERVPCLASSVGSQVFRLPAWTGRPTLDMCFKGGVLVKLPGMFCTSWLKGVATMPATMATKLKWSYSWTSSPLMAVVPTSPDHLPSSFEMQTTDHLVIRSLAFSTTKSKHKSG